MRSKLPIVSRPLCSSKTRSPGRLSSQKGMVVVVWRRNCLEALRIKHQRSWQNKMWSETTQQSTRSKSVVQRQYPPWVTPQIARHRVVGNNRWNIWWRLEEKGNVFIYQFRQQMPQHLVLLNLVRSIWIPELAQRLPYSSYRSLRAR